MVNRVSRILLVTLGAVLAGGTHGGEPQEGQATDAKARIADKLPGVKLENISDGPIDGLFEVTLGPQIVYISEDGRYLLQGDIIDLVANTNVTEERRSVARVAALDGISEAEMIVFSPADAKHTITVFTDVDCTFCRRLHSEMGDLNEMGVRVRYLFYPRGGPGSKSWDKADAVWCAQDRNEALTRAKLGQSLEPKQCETPVARHYEMGSLVGLRGTPAIVTENGRLVSGYLPAAELVQRIVELENPR